MFAWVDLDHRGEFQAGGMPSRVLSVLDGLSSPQGWLRLPALDRGQSEPWGEEEKKWT